MRRALGLASALLTGLIAPAAQAGVQSADDTGFVVGAAQDIAEAPAAVWARLVKPAQWWDSAHTWSGKAANLSLDPRAGGCFCEALPGGGGNEHMRVIRIQPAKQMILAGGLGPLQAEPVSAVLTVTLAAKDKGTVLTWRYAVSGLRGMKGSAIAGPVDQVMTAQFASLARLAANRGAGAPRRR